MAYIDTIRDFRWDRAFLIVIAFVPYVDSEIIGVVPVVRDYVPVDPIYLLDLSWTERGRLALLIVAPMLDGEIVKLLTDREVNEVIADS